MGAGTVLVVDDDDDLRETVEVLLRAHGHPVATAASGLEALAWLRHRAADTCVVLLDLMMPGMDGFTLHSTMSADPVLSPIPVVVVTGAGAAGPPAQRRAAGRGAAQAAGSQCAAGGGSEALSGSTTVKRAPRPGSLAAVI